jgi:protein arginine kinase
MSWYHIAGHQQDTVVCTCVRLSRNLAGYPFPARLEAAGAREIIGKVGAVLEKNGFVSTDFAEISRGAAESLAEKRFIGPRFARESLPHVLYLNDPCNLSVTVCEEDHVRIRCILSGLSLRDAYEGAAKVESLLDGEAELVFDEGLGYLTASPARIGTAMEASVTLFLPLLTACGRMEGMIRRAEGMGLTLRGAGGEGKPFLGGLCRVSNRVTLGIREEEILESLEAAALSLVSAERELRSGLQGEDLDRVTDRICRAEGILRHAHSLSAAEAVELLGLLRLGAAMGITRGVRVEVLTALLTEAMPATLTLGAKPPVKDRGEEDKLRARVVRERAFGDT